MKSRTFSDFWEANNKTRLGQCYGLLVIGTVLGLLGALKSKDLSIAQRAGYGLFGGVGLGILLILVLVIPSMYLGFIRKKKSEGKGVAIHRVLLVLYFFPFLTFSCLGSVAFVVNYLFS
jgi:hypothetical protein